MVSSALKNLKNLKNLVKKANVPLLALLLTCCTGERVVFKVDERAVPNWIFIQLRSDCPSGKTRQGVVYQANDRGYGCTSTPLPSPFRVSVILAKTDGSDDPFPGRLGDAGRVATMKMTCREEELTFYQIFVGSESELREAPMIYDVLQRIGLPCEP